MTNESATTTSGRASVLDVRNLTCTYGDFVAVDDVSISVDAGEIYAVLGVNGAGKTTMLETIQGQRRPSSGKVLVFGREATDRRVVHSRTGIMFQESGFSGDLTALETVTMFGRLSGRSDDPRTVLARAGLEGLAGSRVTQLSGGEKRRLDFAVAVYGNPALLFLDEPTAGLDPVARQRLWDEVVRLRDAGTTVVLTTHYLEEAESYASRIGLMRGGRLVAEGTLETLVARFPRRVRYRTAPADAPLYAGSIQTGAWSTFPVTDVKGELQAFLAWADASDIHVVDLLIDSAGLREFFEPEQGASV